MDGQNFCEEKFQVCHFRFLSLHHRELMMCRHIQQCCYITSQNIRFRDSGYYNFVYNLNSSFHLTKPKVRIPNITPATPFNNTPYENGVFKLFGGLDSGESIDTNLGGGWSIVISFRILL